MKKDSNEEIIQFAKDHAPGMENEVITKINSLPTEDEAGIIILSFKETLLKNKWSVDDINKLFEQWILSPLAEDLIEQMVSRLKELKIDIDYFFKKYNQLIEIKRKKEFKNRLKKEQQMILGRFNPLTVYENVENFHSINPFFFDKNKMYWFWDKDSFKWRIIDHIDLVNGLEQALEVKGQIVTSPILNKYIRSFESIGRKNHPKEPPKEWIQFKNKVFDIKTKQTFEATPEYFFCNPIPWDIGQSNETPTIDALFKQWVGEDYVKSLYQIIAYCCYSGYPIQTAFCLIGHGRNGKTTFQKLLTNFIGVENICSINLTRLIKGNFESAKIFKKSVALIGETNFGLLDDTDTFKKITGGDLISIEFKGKDGFDAYNYAKLIIGSNSMPPSTDTSEGWYRRWFIIDFPNQFKEGKDILQLIPEIEYNNLANKVIEILPELLDQGRFENQGTIDDRKKKYIMISNPLSVFLDLLCDKGENAEQVYVRYSELYLAYVQYLLKSKKRVVHRKEFKEALTADGFDVEKINRNFYSGYYVVGLNLKPNWKDILENVTNVTNVTGFQVSLNDHIRIQKVVTNVTNVTNLNTVNIENNSIERFVDKIIDFLDKANVPLPYTEVEQFCIKAGLTDDQFKAFINKLKQEGIIYEPRSGFLQTLK